MLRQGEACQYTHRGIAAGGKKGFMVGMKNFPAGYAVVRGVYMRLRE